MHRSLVFLGSIVLGAALLSVTQVTDAFAVESAATQAPVTNAAQVIPADNTASGVNLMSVSATAAVAAITPKDMLTLSQEAVAGRGQYQGVRYTLKNTQNAHFQVIHAEVVNAVDETVAANEELQNANRRKRIAGGFLKGLSSLPFSTGLGYSSYGAFRAAATASQVAQSAGDAMQSAASNNVASLEGRFVRQFDGVIISPQQTWSFNTLVAPNTKPQLKLVFKNLETNQIYDIIE